MVLFASCTGSAYAVQVICTGILFNPAPPFWPGETVEFTVDASDNPDYAGAYVMIYTNHIESGGSGCIASGYTDSNGKFKATYTIPNDAYNWAQNSYPINTIDFQASCPPRGFNQEANNDLGFAYSLAYHVPIVQYGVIWNNPADITYGTELSSTQLNAVASIPGTFTYTPPAGTILSVGTQTLHVDFTPTDSTNYTTTSKDVSINVLEKPVAPVASFSAYPTTGKAPLIVAFTDSSTGSPTSWQWSFGDQGTSTTKNPVHTYTKAGKYTVTLTVKNALGTNTKKISNYIVVNKK
jgi:hypothetical protein